MRAMYVVIALAVLGCNSNTTTGGDDLGGYWADLRGAPDLRDITGTDPFPMYCVFDGGTGSHPPVTGTADCPSDKNVEGCPCDRPGDTAKCWPGHRKNRNLGLCTDGTATCKPAGELASTWGPCVGAVLPVEGAHGKAACECFSLGRWAIENLGICFGSKKVGDPPGNNGAWAAGLVGGKLDCDNKPAVWSKDTVKADCVGHFKLCYTLKAGNADSPQPTDCEVGHSCTEGDYSQENVTQDFKALPYWEAKGDPQIACAQKFAATGGYGEMSVVGTTLLCDMLNKPFNRVNYCPLKCNMAGHENDPDCKGCMAGGSGDFTN